MGPPLDDPVVVAVERLPETVLPELLPSPVLALAAPVPDEVAVDMEGLDAPPFDTPVLLPCMTVLLPPPPATVLLPSPPPAGEVPLFGCEPQAKRTVAHTPIAHAGRGRLPRVARVDKDLARNRDSASCMRELRSPAARVDDLRVAPDERRHGGSLRRMSRSPPDQTVF
jgi:hypothetical protein